MVESTVRSISRQAGFGVIIFRGDYRYAICDFGEESNTDSDGKSVYMAIYFSHNRNVLRC